MITYTLDALSRRDAIARPNGAASDFGYDLASRLTSLSHDVSGTANDLTRTFTYNLASQLATRVNATAAHAFSPAPGTSVYAVNGRNQYTTVAGATLSHDLNGNLTGNGSRTFTYDAENRLLSVSGSANLTLNYDPLGRLRQTTAGAVTTDFLYEGDRLIGEYNGSTLLRRYAHGPGVDEPIVWYEGSRLTDKRWLHPDERGSIVAWSNASAGATVYRYGAYGEPAGNDFSGSRFRYTGQIALPEAKLYHYKARVYDPTLGRFLQTDPVGYEDDFNLYAYVYNDPLNRIDPAGKEGACVVIDGCRTFGQADPGEAAGVVADFTPIVGDIKGIAEAVNDPTTVNIIAAVVGVVPGVGDVASKTLKVGAKAVESAADVNRAASRAKGVPDSQIGPSGKPKVHTVQHSTTKGAEEAAQRQVPEGGKVRFDAHPKDGQNPHYQAEDAKGENVKPVVHHCPPNKRC